MVEKFATLWPEIALLVGAVACLLTGLAPSQALRNFTPWVAGLALVGAGLLVAVVPTSETAAAMAGVTDFVKLAVVGIGLVLLLVAAGVPSQLKQTQQTERARIFEPGNIMRGEFFAFFLFSLVGVMLTAGASDLVWLFLALELTSLPTYVMVATSRDRIEAQESAVKYFFLGAMAAAIFLYGFALIYGATGFTDFTQIAAVIPEQLAGPNRSLLLTGLVLAVVGVCFKIAAVPMHYYAADVYEGAATPVTAFLAFVPKTAGFVALMLLLNLVGWDPLPDVLIYLLWALAVLTMTVGNVLGLLQNNVKRVLAYSSIAHSGYMIIGLMVGPGDGVLNNGLAAVLFYLVAYGLGTIGAFAVLGSLRAHGEEAQTFDDLNGLARRHPGLAAIMLLSVLSLLGIPPLVGFLGKVYLFVPAFSAGFVVLVVIALLNSAVSAAYYLRIASVCYFGQPAEGVQSMRLPGRFAGAAVAAIAALVLGLAGTQLVDAAHHATQRPTATAQQQPGDNTAVSRADDR
ncbi:MAG: NADH-quinone oxidoreductase subunit N [Phycisphaeraceae bacterium]